MLSRWQGIGGASEGNERKSRKEARRKKMDGELTVNVSANLVDYVWDMLHSGHMGLPGMLHRRNSWGLVASKSQLEERVRNYDTCRRH